MKITSLDSARQKLLLLKFQAYTNKNVEFHIFFFQEKDRSCVFVVVFFPTGDLIGPMVLEDR